MNNYKKQTYVTRLQKAYSTLSNAIQLIAVSQGCSTSDLECANFYGTDSSLSEKAMIDALSKHLKGQVFSSYDCPSVSSENKGIHCLIAEDGVIYSSYHNPYIDGFIVDVNGGEKPNILGRDRFAFITRYYDYSKRQYSQIKSGITPSGSQESSYDWKNTEYGCKHVPNVSNSSYYGYIDSLGGTCTARVLEKGKMDY